MNKKIAYIGFSACLFFLASCNSNKDQKQDSTIDSANNQRETNVNMDSTLKVFSVGRDKNISFDTLKIRLPENFNVASKDVYNGIYEVKDNSLARHKVLTNKNLAFFTTSEDLGKGIRAYLYVFDTSRKGFIRDSDFRRDYLYSAAGIFLIDPLTNKIFAVDKSEWYDAKQQHIIPASVYEVRSGAFINTRNVYKIGDEIPADTALASFFKHALSVDSKDILPLPKDWWRVK